MGKKKRMKGNETSASRPRALLQRISSGFTSLLPSRREHRATTAPVQLFQQCLPTRPVGPRPESQLISRISLPRLSGRNEKQSCESSRPNIIASTEDAQCDICSMRVGSRRPSESSALYRPCSNCRSSSQSSHICFSYRPSRASVSGVSNTGDNVKHENVRTVLSSMKPEKSCSRTRRVSLPVGTSRLQRDTLQVPTLQHTRKSSTTSSRNSYDIQSISVRREQRPVSPSLHHIHGFPRSKEFPYVHKHEVETHMIALRAGLPKPLRDRGMEASDNTASPETFVDYSRTVYYTRSATPSGSRSTSTVPTRHARNSQSTATASTRDRQRISSFQEELVSSHVYRRRSPQCPTARITDSQIDEEEDSFSTLTTQTPSTVGGKRLELKGGGRTVPRLRGGAGKNSFLDRFLFKRWLLTCHRSRYDGESSDEGTEQACEMMCRGKVNGLHQPQHLTPSPYHCPQCLAAREILERAYLPKSHIDIIAHTPHMSTQNNDNDSEPCPIPTPAQSQPYLRGSSGLSSTFNDLRLPPTLYWLAGGRGSPIKVSSWKSQRGKTRTGGLWGMAVHGSKAGAKWEVKVETNDDIDVKVEVKINGEKILDKRAESEADAAVGVKAAGQYGGVKENESSIEKTATEPPQTAPDSLPSPDEIPSPQVLSKPVAPTDATDVTDRDPFPEAKSGPGEVRDV